MGGSWDNRGPGRSSGGRSCGVMPCAVYMLVVGTSVAASDSSVAPTSPVLTILLTPRNLHGHALAR